MNQLEQGVQPILIPVLKNQRITFSVEQIDLLARYFFMKAVVADQSSYEKPRVPENERIEFFRTQVVPKTVDINAVFIPALPDPDLQAFNREMPKVTNAITGEVFFPANITFSWGSMFVQVMRNPLVPPNLTITSSNLPLWPSEMIPRSWPLTQATTIQEGMRIQTFLEHILGSKQ